MDSTAQTAPRDSEIINELLLQVVEGARRRGEFSTFKSRKCVWYLSGKCGETRKYCLLLVENGMGVAT
jgi:hypothetical protein